MQKRKKLFIINVLFYTSGLDRNIAELFLQMKIKTCIHITFQEHDISCSICIKVNDPPSFDKHIFLKKVYTMSLVNHCITINPNPVVSLYQRNINIIRFFKGAMLQII